MQRPILVQLFCLYESGVNALFVADAVGLHAQAEEEENLMNPNESFDHSTYADQINLAERELASFIGAVKELFGPEQALLSAADWLDESELMDNPPRSTSRDWRAVTVAASARLANRVTGARDHRTPAASTDPKVSPIPSSNRFASALLV